MTATPDLVDAGHVAPATVRATVPASSANLGPGFDVLAVALDLTLEVTVAPFDGRRVVASGEGVGELPGDDDNLVWRAVVAFCEHHGVAVPDVTLHCRNAIPLQRGLGSSSAAAVAGLVLARHVTGVSVGDEEVVALAARLEGHPDNAAAAVLGGLVVAGEGRSRRFEPTRTLRPVACVPAQRAATSAARGLVPVDVTLSALVDAARGTALVLAGLAGLTAWDPTAMRDAVHEPPRLAAMPASRRLVDAVRGGGDAACLSGAGPSVLAVVPSDDREAVGRIRRLAGDGWQILPLHWDRAGARVDRVAGSTS